MVSSESMYAIDAWSPEVREFNYATLGAIHDLDVRG